MMKDEHTACCHVQEVPQRERDNLQHAAALELAGYAAIFEAPDGASSRNVHRFVLIAFSGLWHVSDISKAKEV